MLEMGTYRLMWKGMESRYGWDIEPLSEETERNR